MISLLFLGIWLLIGFVTIIAGFYEDRHNGEGISIQSFLTLMAMGPISTIIFIIYLIDKSEWFESFKNRNFEIKNPFYKKVIQESSNKNILKKKIG